MNLCSEIRTEYRNGIYRSSEIDRPIELLLAKLEKMGFIFSIREQQVELLRLALKTYKSIYNDLNISKVCRIILLTLTYHNVLRPDV